MKINIFNEGGIYALMDAQMENWEPEGAAGSSAGLRWSEKAGTSLAIPSVFSAHLPSTLCMSLCAGHVS